MTLKTNSYRLGCPLLLLSSFAESDRCSARIQSSGREHLPVERVAVMRAVHRLNVPSFGKWAMLVERLSFKPIP